MDCGIVLSFYFFLLLKGAIMVFIDIFIMAILVISWPHLMRRMRRDVQPILDALAIVWRHIKRRMHRHGHSSKPATSTISDGRQL